MHKTIERRTFPVQELRVSQNKDEMPMIKGHAAVFGQMSEDLGGFREQIAPGAFASAISNCDVRALFNHDSNMVLGRNVSGTLRMSEDETGLAIEIDAPDTSYARDLLECMKRGDINQMSFGFRTIKDAWAETDGEYVRTLLDVELFDVSPVTYPAYPQTDCAVRSLDSFKQEHQKEPPFNDIQLRKKKLELDSLE